MEAAKDKRQYQRVGFRRTVRVFPVLPSKSGNIYEVQKDSIWVQADNISEGGLLLATEQFSKSSLILKLNFEVGLDRMVEVYGKVIWVEGGRCGVRFLFADNELRKAVRGIARKADNA
ncbi:MAG TPA: PilZ domain-containing protein [bacterium]|nr:PilZ domain-containing protein [bacterium]